MQSPAETLTNGSLEPVLLYERCLLGALVMSPDTRAALAQMDAILPACVMSPSHQPVLESIRGVAARGKEGDLVNLCAELSARGELDRVGGRERMMALVEECPDINGVEKYARSILEYRNRQRAQALASAITVKLSRGDVGAVAAEVDRLGGLVQAAADSTAPTPPIDFQKHAGALLKTAHDSLANVEEEVDYILEPVFTVANLTQLHGEPKSGKSCVGLYLAICAATGVNPGGDQILAKKSCPVLFVTYEDGPRRLKRRIIDYMAGLGFDACYPPEFWVWFKPDIDLGNPQGVECMTSALALTKAKLLVLDTISHLHRADENDASQMKLVMANLARIARDAPCAILYLHHSAKAQEGKSAVYRGRGSSAIAAAADIILDWDRPVNDVTKCEFISKDDEGKRWLFRYIRIPEGVRWEVVSQEPKDAASNKGGRLSREDRDREWKSAVLSTMQALALQGDPNPSGRAIAKVMFDHGLGRTKCFDILKELAVAGEVEAVTKAGGKGGGFKLPAKATANP